MPCALRGTLYLCSKWQALFKVFARVLAVVPWKKVESVPGSCCSSFGFSFSFSSGGFGCGFGFGFSSGSLEGILS